MPHRQEALVDKLQVMVPLLQRIAVTLRQQTVDVTSALSAAEAMVALVRPDDDAEEDANV